MTVGPIAPPNASVVVPVYNSRDTPPKLVGRLSAALRDVAGAFEIVLVNDGSRDESRRAIGELAARSPVHGVDLMRNYIGSAGRDRGDPGLSVVIDRWIAARTGHVAG
jgi:glycosyltransferase involved in cell wall biosynthesis